MAQAEQQVEQADQEQQELGTRREQASRLKLTAFKARPLFPEEKIAAFTKIYKRKEKFFL